MANDYGIDNKGNGFFDDGEELDLDKMLETASRGSSIDDEKDYSDLFFDNDSNQVTAGNPVSKQATPAPQEQKQEPVQEVYEDDYVDEVVDENVWEIPEIEDPVPAPIPARDRIIDIPQEKPIIQQPVVEQRVEYVAEKPPVASQQPVQETPRRQFNEISEKQPEVREVKRQVMIKSAEDEIADVRKVINILDTYRGLESDDVRDIVSQFVGNDDATDESTLVVKVLESVNTALYETMIALREAAVESDRVERVFYILRLEDSLLISLGELVDSINENKIGPADGDKIGFSKSVEEAINKMDGRVISYVTATQTVLAAATSN